MFKPYEVLINKALQLDPKSKHRLKTLKSKNIKIEIRNFNMKFPIALTFDEQGIHFSQPQHRVFDAIIHGPLTAFLCLALTKDPHQAAILGLNFEGNLDVAQMAEALFLDLDLDWEEVLSKFTNDSFASNVGQFFKSFKKRNLQVVSSIMQSMTEYLQEESRVIVSPKEAEAFYKDIESLRDSVERLEAKMHLLEKRLQHKKPTSKQTMPKKATPKKTTSEKPIKKSTKKSTKHKGNKKR